MHESDRIRLERFKKEFAKELKSVDPKLEEFAIEALFQEKKPHTREAFDLLYENMKREGISDPKSKIEDDAKLAREILRQPILLDIMAEVFALTLTNPNLVRTIDTVADSMQIPPEQVSTFWNKPLAILDAPADARLTPDEKTLVELNTKIMKICVDRGYLQNTIGDAPPDSSWATQMKKAAAARDGSVRKS